MQASQIKFRVWNADKKVMRMVKAIDWLEDGTVITCHTDKEKLYFGYEGSPAHQLMRFTGESDKNGKEIYEGDLIQVIYRHRIHETIITPVYWKWAGWHGADDYLSYLVTYCDVTVIGHIYEVQRLPEIQFKAKRVETRGWVYGYYVKTPLTAEVDESGPEDGWHFLSGVPRHCIVTLDGVAIEVDPRTIRQSTGLYDGNRTKEHPNGKLIFEGDLMPIGMSSSNNTLKPIIEAVQLNHGIWEPAAYYTQDAIDIIGNIDDDPELLG